MESEHAIELLESAPADEYSLVEFELEWDRLQGPDAQIAAALRLFVISRDPLSWLQDRGGAWATVNADGETLEVPIYITLGELQTRMEASGSGIEEILASLAATALTAALQAQGSILSGAYAELAVAGAVPRLVEGSATMSKESMPAAKPRSGRLEPVGLGVVQDLVQEAFGPVDFDRSTVLLGTATDRVLSCPACSRARFGFPGDLAESQDQMCPAHRSEAAAVTAVRIARARSSNPTGWRAIEKGSARISRLPEPGDMPAPQRRRSEPGRNEPCQCGSGRKYKNCCGR